MRSYFQGLETSRHSQSDAIGVVLINLGTPEAPTPGAVRSYLREFLSDRRVIELPKWLWWLLLNCIILPIRGFRSAANYQKIWRPEGSPLKIYTQALIDQVQSLMDQHPSGAFKVRMAMNYGTPSVADTLRELQTQGAKRLLIVPLYPQYSGTTTASVFDRVAQALGNTRWVPDLRFVSQYYERSDYIEALAKSVETHWQSAGRGDQLLLSFHGIPERYFNNGDLYHCHCYGTARLLRERLGIGQAEMAISFQSRVGREKWLEPYTDATIQKLAESGTKKLDVICPGFAVDCLETLEEICQENADHFLAHGGEALRYIPALNDRVEHARVFQQLILEHCQGWPELSQTSVARAERAAGVARRVADHEAAQR